VEAQPNRASKATPLAAVAQAAARIAATIVDAPLPRDAWIDPAIPVQRISVDQDFFGIQRGATAVFRQPRRGQTNHGERDDPRLAPREEALRRLASGARSRRRRGS